MKRRRWLLRCNQVADCQLQFSRSRHDRHTHSILALRLGQLPPQTASSRLPLERISHILLRRQLSSEQSTPRIDARGADRIVAAIAGVARVGAAVVGVAARGADFAEWVGEHFAWKRTTRIDGGDYSTLDMIDAAVYTFCP